ncbi:transmembrane protein 144-like [Mytilus edulis]|uniref:transmembrane protein 144-like n=1 Tax=Mytilus edulis TaxID=6550 RepID=UPI0039F0CAC7
MALTTASSNITSWQSSHIPSTSSVPLNMTSFWTNSTESYNTTYTHTTAVPFTDDTIPEYLGFIAAGIAVLFFGSVPLPVKKYETGDGLFFQWIFCSGVMLAGIVVQLIRQQPPFFPIAMTGGVVFAFGNICVVPIVKTIGLGLGFGIWSMVCLLSGWSTGRFGFFGVDKSIPEHITMNYLGVAICVLSAFVFVMVKTEVTPVQDEETEALLVTEYPKNASSIKVDTAIDEISYFDMLSPGMRKIVGLLLCIFSGLMYGQMFTGATYVQDHRDHYPGATINGLDYVFADFCGVYLTSTTFFVTYIIVMKFKPKVYPKVMIPALISGVMWAIGNSCWFIANRALSIPVAFPIVTTGPSIVASLWGVIVFKEIKGTYNLLILVIAFTMGITGAILAGVSKN